MVRKQTSSHTNRTLTEGLGTHLFTLRILPEDSKGESQADSCAEELEKCWGGREELWCTVYGSVLLG